MRDGTAKTLSSLHTVLYRASGGLLGRRLVRNDMLLLTTTGRRSGRPHTVPLLYLTEGAALVVVASWGGRPHHPDWFLNLEEDPRALVQVRRHRWPVRARRAAPDVKAVLWPRFVAAYPGYRQYQARTDRDIPVVLLHRDG